MLRVKIIPSIGQETKLLALNTTVQVVRAEAVGKGFAAAANEVREWQAKPQKPPNRLTKQSREFVSTDEAVATILRDLRKANCAKQQGSG